MEGSNFSIIQIIIIIIFYLGTSIWLTIYNKKINNKFSIMAWIPILKIYLLGKLLINKIAGICFMIVSIILNALIMSACGGVTETRTETLFGTIVEKETFDADWIINVYAVIFVIFELILFIILAIKLNKNKKIVEKQYVSME